MTRVLNDAIIDGNITLNGATSGTITLEASATTTPYTLIFPSADAVGALSSDGAGNLSFSAFNGLNDIDGNTQIQVEESADEDIIRFDVGDSPAGYGAVADIMTLSSSGWTVTMGTADTAATAGAPITFTSGTGNTSGVGGAISLTAGDGGASAAGGAITIRAGDAGVGSGGDGGDITLDTGAGDGAGVDGDVIFQAGGTNFMTFSASSGQISATTGDLILVHGSGGIVQIGTSGDAGLINPAINNLGISTAGSEQWRIDANGNLEARQATVSITTQVGAIGGNNGGTLNINTGNGSGTDGAGGTMFINPGDGLDAGAGGSVAITGGTGGATGSGGTASLAAGDGGATSGVGGNITLTTGTAPGEGVDSDGAIVLETGVAGGIETIRGYFSNDTTGASTTVATIPITSGDSAVFEIWAVAREEAGTESAAFRIFGGVENTAGTAALIGSTAKDRTDDGAASVDWDVIAGVSGGNLTVSVNSDVETVDWKIKVKLMEL